MTERPLPFIGPMVRAVLDGRKTQTRRVVKPQPEADVDSPYHVMHKGALVARRCPYGAPGDRLWVRETWCVGYEYVPGWFTSIPFHGCENRRRAFYKATDDDGVDEPKRPWKSPRFMPRWASRILLEVIATRIERVQDISEADAEAEGPSQHPDWPRTFHSTWRYAFRDLWDSINEKRGNGWVANPYVWVVEFRRVLS